MAHVKTRRPTSASIDGGLGLLEMILPQGGQDDPDSTLPPGQRDAGGFWFPSGYMHPGDIFTPAQRQLQAKQRQVQRRRHQGRPAAPAEESEAAPHGPLAEGPADRPLPLPTPSLEVPEAALSSRRVPAGLRAHQAVATVHHPLSEAELARAVAARPVVDSQKGSD